MRNLKRALSLTLASVMLLGMMVVGSSAAGYPDVDEEDNVEAIEVLQAVKVMVGDENGNFDPDRNVSRTEMAVIMALLLDLDYEYYEASCPFWDVPTWARGYVGACYANKTIYGYSATTYGAADSITPVQAAAMMMRALGYFQYAEDTKDGFELSTVRQGTQIGIFDGVGSSATAPMTRNQVAKMALNALQSEMVSFTGTPGTQYTAASGETLSIGYRAEYTPRTSTEAKYNAIEGRTSDVASDLNHKGQYYIQLGEQLYNGELKLYGHDTDDFERPARTWEYKGEQIGTYVKEELLRKEYTAKVTGKDLYDLLTKNTIDTYRFVIAIDGETDEAVLKSVATTADAQYYFTQDGLIRTNTKAVGGTDNGVLTQVFVDPDEGANGTVYISIINTYLAVADDDYDEDDDEVDFTVWGIEEYNTNSNRYVKNCNNLSSTNTASFTEPFTVSGEDFDVADVKDDDVVLVNVAKGEIQKIRQPEVIDNTTLSAFKRNSWVKADGTQYDYADTARYDDEVLDLYVDNNMKDTTYRIYLDQYGYLIGIEIIEEPDQYVFLAGIDDSRSNRANMVGYGTGIFLDGTVAELKIDMDKSKTAGGTKFNANGSGMIDATTNTWCTYSVSDDNVYTLTEVAYKHDDFTNNGVGKADKVGQSRNEDGFLAKVEAHETGYTDNTYATYSTKLDGTASVVALDKKHVTLNGIQDKAASAIKSVYANKDTVFLVAELDRISADTPQADAIIIKGVDGLYTGVQNVSLKAYNTLGVVNSDRNFRDWNAAGTSVTGAPNADNISHGVYTLFKDNGYVIGAVVVGEDEGTSSQFAYVTSGDVNEEEYQPNKAEKSNGKGDWTWTRNVIIDGKKATLVEKGDVNPYIAPPARGGVMERGNWYEVKYDADGNVRKVSSALNFQGGGAFKYVSAIENVEQSVVANDTVVMCDDMQGENVKVRVNGITLQVETRTGQKSGFAVKDDANIVLIKDTEIFRNGVSTDKYDVMDEVKEVGQGQSGLDKAVKGLEDNDSFNGVISAVFDGGLATSVIIWDRTPNSIDIGGTGTSTGNLSFFFNGNAIVVGYTGSDRPAEADVVAAIVAHLQSKGYTVGYTDSLGVHQVSKSGDSYRFPTIRTESGVQVTQTFTWNAETATYSGYKQVVKLTLADGTTFDTEKGENVKAKDIAADAGVKTGKYVKVTEYDTDGNVVGTPAYKDYSASTDEIDTTKTIKLDFGYYEITAESSVNKTGSNASSATVTAALAGRTFAKAVNTDVEVTLTFAGGGTTGAGLVVSATTKVGTEDPKSANVDPSILAGISTSGTPKVTVSIPAAAITGDVAITLTLTDNDEVVVTDKDGNEVDVSEVTSTTTWQQLADLDGFRGNTSNDEIKDGMYVKLEYPDGTSKIVPVDDQVGTDLLPGTKITFGFLNASGMTADQAAANVTQADIQLNDVSKLAEEGNTIAVGVKEYIKDITVSLDKANRMVTVGGTYKYLDGEDKTWADKTFGDLGIPAPVQQYVLAPLKIVVPEGAKSCKIAFGDKAISTGNVYPGKNWEDKDWHKGSNFNLWSTVEITEGTKTLVTIQWFADGPETQKVPMGEGVTFTYTCDGLTVEPYQAP